MPKQLATQIFSLLNDINRSPDFHVYQSSKAFFPQLNIHGLDELALPLCEAQAKQLITYCSKAPYGKGTETIVDENVRKVWELDASKVSNGNQTWQRFLAKTLRDCEKKLDLQGQTLVAYPYKLLVYEEGSFFLAHQDTEKEDGMVATLVVALPSTHQGGELTITHQDKSVSVDFSDETKRYSFQSVMFYADCYHEVSPVKKGYRLVLTYNICLKGKRKLAGFDFSKQEQMLSQIFASWKNSLKDNDKKQLIISLDHQYSADGFSLDSLKGVDRSKADVLLHSAEKAGCKAYICLIEKYEMFTAWEEDELDELIESYHSVQQLIDTTGKEIDLVISSFEEDEIVSLSSLNPDKANKEEAIEQDYEGYMGNYGNTLSRWYRHAAVILWPLEYQLEILARNDTSSAISYIKDLYTNKDPKFSSDLRLLFSMVDNGSCRPDDKQFTLLTLMLTQKDEILAKRYCRHFLFTQDGLPSIKNIQQLIKLCGWAYIEEFLDIKDDSVRLRLLELLNKIKATLAWDQHPELERLFYSVVAESSNKNGWRNDAQKNFELIYPLCLGLTTRKSTEALTHFLASHRSNLSAENYILPYLEKQGTHLSNTSHIAAFNAVKNWLGEQFQDYYQRIKQKPEAALVEAIPDIECNCDDCSEIVNFMQSEEDEVELRKLKAQCEHISSQLQLYRVQVDYRINKHRRPWRFIMRKYGADQRARIAAYKKSKHYIERLEGLN
jgi:predicted 2-oxoglutarate/Fe(II)-dependent dioxygenase YbiX